MVIKVTLMKIPTELYFIFILLHFLCDLNRLFGEVRNG